jgi:hypothetical protein
METPVPVDGTSDATKHIRRYFVSASTNQIFEVRCPECHALVFVAPHSDNIYLCDCHEIQVCGVSLTDESGKDRRACLISTKTKRLPDEIKVRNLTRPDEIINLSEQEVVTGNKFIGVRSASEKVPIFLAHMPSGEYICERSTPVKAPVSLNGMVLLNLIPCDGYFPVDKQEESYGFLGGWKKREVHPNGIVEAVELVYYPPEIEECLVMVSESFHGEEDVFDEDSYPEDDAEGMSIQF